MTPELSRPAHNSATHPYPLDKIQKIGEQEQSQQGDKPHMANEPQRGKMSDH